MMFPRWIPSRRPALWLASGLAMGLALLLAACGRHPDASGKGRVLLIGLDGAEWNLLRPMMAAGELPNLQKLVDRGVSGDLRSLEPLQKSPAIWTTIATGKAPEEHGIRSFVDSKDGKPLTQNLRRVRALWSIFSAAGRSVGVVGWLMSWPAEQVNGFVVSDYIQYQAARKSRLDDRTWPPELYDEIESLNRDWQSMPQSEINQFLSMPVGEKSSDSLLVQSIRPIKWIIGGDQVFTDIALKLGKRDRPDFLAVYLRGMDEMAHLYWNYQSPESYPPDVTDPALAPYFKDTMRLTYKWVDRQVGRLLDLADDKTTIVVCSDHGFAGGGHGGIQDHRLEGVLIMAGAHVGHGVITGASVYDIAPTVLAIMGFPKADDMRGKVLWNAFDGSIRPQMFTTTIATYETGPSGPRKAVGESPVDEELKERLRSLGYIK